MSRKRYTAAVMGACFVHVLVTHELARAADRAPRDPSTAKANVRELAHGR
jgi:hypothetical protein